jgi:hypothetical protein
MELTPQSYGSYLALLRQEYDLAPLFRRRSIPADVALMVDHKLILLTTIEFDAAYPERPYRVRRWKWDIPQMPGFGRLETLLIATGGVVI